MTKGYARISFDGLGECFMPHVKETWFVGSLQGEDGKDWGWTKDRSQAKELSTFWKRRFLADRRACGYQILK